MALYKADQSRTLGQSNLGHSTRCNSAIAYHMEPLDNWINSVLLHTLALRCLAFWEIKWSLYYTGSVVLLVCYTAKQDSSSTRGAKPLLKDFLAMVFCDNFRIWTEGVELSVVHHYTIILESILVSISLFIVSTSIVMRADWIFSITWPLSAHLIFLWVYQGPHIATVDKL